MKPPHFEFFTFLNQRLPNNCTCETYDVVFCFWKLRASDSMTQFCGIPFYGAMVWIRSSVCVSFAEKDSKLNVLVFFNNGMLHNVWLKMDYQWITSYQCNKVTTKHSRKYVQQTLNLCRLPCVHLFYVIVNWIVTAVCNQSYHFELPCIIGPNMYKYNYMLLRVINV